jgi:hypothetical protein
LREIKVEIIPHTSHSKCNFYPIDFSLKIEVVWERVFCWDFFKVFDGELKKCWKTIQDFLSRIILIKKPNILKKNQKLNSKATQKTLSKFLKNHAPKTVNSDNKKADY